MKLRLPLALIALSPFYATAALALPEKQIPVDYGVFDEGPAIPGSDLPDGVFDSPYKVDDLAPSPKLSLPDGGFEDNPVDPSNPGAFDLDPLLKKDKSGNLTEIYKTYNKVAPILQTLGGIIKKNLGFNVAPWLEYGDFLIGREKQETLASQSGETIAGVPIGALQGPNGEVDPALVESQALEEFEAKQQGDSSLFGMPTDVVKKHLVGLSLTRAGLKKQQTVLGQHGQQFAKESLDLVNQFVKNAGDLSTKIVGQNSTQDVNKGIGEMLANNTLLDRAQYVEAQQARLNQEKQLDVALRQLEESQQKEWGEEVDERMDEAGVMYSSSLVMGFVQPRTPSNQGVPPGTIAASSSTAPSTPTQNPFLQ